MKRRMQASSDSVRTEYRAHCGESRERLPELEWTRRKEEHTAAAERPPESSAAARSGTRSLGRSRLARPTRRSIRWTYSFMMIKC